MIIALELQNKFIAIFIWSIRHAPWRSLSRDPEKQVTQHSCRASVVVHRYLISTQNADTILIWLHSINLSLNLPRFIKGNFGTVIIKPLLGGICCLYDTGDVLTRIESDRLLSYKYNLWLDNIGHYLVNLIILLCIEINYLNHLPLICTHKIISRILTRNSPGNDRYKTLFLSIYKTFIPYSDIRFLQYSFVSSAEMKLKFRKHGGSGYLFRYLSASHLPLELIPSTWSNYITQPHILRLTS